MVIIKLMLNKRKNNKYSQAAIENSKRKKKPNINWINKQHIEEHLEEEEKKKPKHKTI